MRKTKAADSPQREASPNQKNVQEGQKQRAGKTRSSRQICDHCGREQCQNRTER